MEEIKKYQVCIRCYTYNQALYISDALESFVIQKTNFPFVIVVVDDASSDGEQEVIRDFINKNFNVHDQATSYTRDTDLANIIYAQHSTNKNCYIAAILLKHNLYKEPDKKSVLVDEWRNQSKYEALCEGDDWWLSDEKLQRQFDILENHPEIDMCACGTSCFKDGKIQRHITPSSDERILSVEEVILGGGGYLGTNSLMHRVSLLHDGVKYWKTFYLDFFNQIHGALRGGIYYISECMAAYRLVSQGSWRDRMKGERKKYFFHVERINETLNLLDRETEFKYHEYIERRKIINYRSMFVNGLRNHFLFEVLSFSDKIKLSSLIFKA